MSLQDLGSIGEFVAAIATLTTLVYLAIQVRSNTNTMRESNTRLHTDRMIGHSRMVAVDKELANIFRRGSKDIESLSDEERWQFGTYLWSIFIDFQDEFHASKNLRLDDYHWNFQEENMLYYLGKRGIRSWWDSLELKLDPEFVEHVNELLVERVT
jgi:hypothetical protein